MYVCVHKLILLYVIIIVIIIINSDCNVTKFTDGQVDDVSKLSLGENLGENIEIQSQSNGQSTNK